MLTNTKAREAKPREARYEITCESLPGFILRVLPTGKKVFFVRYRDAQGMDHRERLGLMAPGYGVDEARRAAMKVLAHAGEDESPPESSPRTQPRGARSEPPASRAEKRPAARTTKAAPRKAEPEPQVAESTARATKRPATRTAEPAAPRRRAEGAHHQAARLARRRACRGHRRALPTTTTSGARSRGH
jgi:hypothetical protein